MIGIHSPELRSQRKLAGLRAQLKQHKVTFPVLVDNDHANWRRWGQRAWPTIYLLDKQGRTRYRWIGRLDYRGVHGAAEMTRKIEALLKEPYRPPVSK